MHMFQKLKKKDLMSKIMREITLGIFQDERFWLVNNRSPGKFDRFLIHLGMYMYALSRVLQECKSFIMSGREKPSININLLTTTTCLKNLFCNTTTVHF